MNNVFPLGAKGVLVDEPLEQFSRFWDLYPRKIARAHALKMWLRLNAAERAAATAAIPQHVALWDAEQCDRRHIPHAGTWLNPVDGRRWEDEIEMPEAKTPQVDWWKSDQGIEAKGKELGMSAYGHETYPQYRDRLMSAIRSGRRAA